MIITNISGGFGNQLFMYACGYAVAKRLGTKLKLDISYLATDNLRDYELDKLNIRYDSMFSVFFCKYYLLKVICRKLVHAWMKCRYNFFYEKQGYTYDDTIKSVPNNTYLYGYWQTEKYFVDCRKDILKMFTPKYALSKGCKDYIQQVSKCQSVAVHVRRGDYVALGNCLGPEYYDRAVETINSQIQNPIFYVFSDDMEYAKEMFVGKQGTYKYVEYKSDNLTLDDFFIMKECRHIIMANSSFSWWAAWLNDYADKIVVCPKEKQWDGDFYPNNWIKL